MTELAIVGNGFELHHGLQTSYGSFAQFAKDHSSNVYTLLSELFLASSEYMGLDRPPPTNEKNFVYDRWCDFESCLGLLDDEEFVQRSQEGVSEYMQELGMEEHLVDEFVHGMASILDTFRDWVLGIDLPMSHQKGFIFEPTTVFVNFNYTETLETFYKVDPARIFYIHGRRASQDRLIVGHDTSPPKPQSKHDLPDVQFNPFYGYLRLTRKPIEDIEPKLRAWLVALPDIDRISVRGHSLGFVDFPYFETINKLHPSATWSFSYFNEEDLGNIRNVIQSLDLKHAAVLSVAKLSEFEVNPNTQTNALQAQRSLADLLRFAEGK
ncbi:bacteriophage abortive infection AbiH family protein [Leisingera sp. M527]|uniref:bacteriophage abortive infection AbiH family protein n=1 Tax=Leisingera sp. M527 TaxID=2867014 RepID=UPI0021A7D6DF|nr:bacteriophage abortive infection AbiH family protein [Leisingera sp. M527]UWQ32084.1 bacteriophage abortive infection AbiH family protein [Leisingera sp. M527]